MSVDCYIGIGSNVGNRRFYITSALMQIRRLRRTQVIKLSRIITSDPIGGPAGQGKFLNAVVHIRTSLSAIALLRGLQKIENGLGRIRLVRNGPRTIDLDILLYGFRVINRKNLCVPHLRLLQRSFVVQPLLEVL